jgi:quercetin dioxygenase-like cupin family protein
MIKRKGIDYTAVQNPDYCEQPLLLNAKDSYIVYFDENTQDRPSYVAWYTPTAGDHMEGEMSDTLYSAGDGIPYHEHNRGHEVFLVDGGDAELTIRGLHSTVNTGDIVFVPPYVSHGFKFLSNPTIWREWFQGIKMNEGLLEQRRFCKYGDPSLSTAYFDQKLSSRLGTEWFSFTPVVREVEKDEIPFVRTFDFAYDTFEFPGIRMLQKIARYEMDGNIEFWQYRMDREFCMSVNMWNPHGIRWAVFSGSIRVDVPGLESFVAGAGDIINIPSYMPCKLIACEDGTVVHDFACKGILFRALEHVRAMKAENDDILNDPGKLATLFEEKYDLFIMWDLGK